MSILYEFRAHPRRSSKPLLFEKSRIAGKNGFISVFGYPQETAHKIIEQGGTFGLAQTELYSDLVVIDFDNADAAFAKALATCMSSDFSFRAYHTGNRGYHIHIDIEPLIESGIHKRMETWVSQRFSGYDPSLYKTSAVTRIPGTVHTKTGKTMYLVAFNGGDVRPDIREANIPMPISASPFDDTEGSEEDLGDIFLFMLRKTIHSGERHQYAYRLAALANRIGTDKDDAHYLIDEWNSARCMPPITDRALLHAVNSAYRNRRGA